MFVISKKYCYIDSYIFIGSINIPNNVYIYIHIFKKIYI